MKKLRKLFFLIVVLLPASLSAQLVVNTSTFNTDELVQNILIGQGNEVSNITFNGVNFQRGYFNGSNSNIGINSGVILATGNSFVATGPNDLDNATQPEDSGCGTPSDQPPFTGPGGLCRPGDSDLDSILAGTTQTFDAAVLEFDFIPQSDTIRFNYVFASEEYSEFVCSDFNDLFGVFLSGPNPTGGNYNEVNIALIPGTSLPVAVNTINFGILGSEGSPFECNDPTGSLDFGSLYNDNTLGTTMQFDGFTDKLGAFANVVPCEVYHIKIAIADAGDGTLDSAVFLEENSFASNTLDVEVVKIDTENNIETSGNTLGESCDFVAEITFSLSYVTPVEFNIPFTIGGTATNGTDYAILPNTIFIPAGQSEVTLVIDPLEDSIVEGVETIIFEIETSVCETKIFTIAIGEVMPLTAPVMLCGVGTAGSAGFEWQAVPDATGYEVSEDGGMTWMTPTPGPLTHNFTGLGQNETAELLVRALGGIACEGNPTSTLLCSSSNCELTTTASSISSVSCNGGNDGSASVTANSGVPPFTYQWDANASNQNTATAIGLAAGIYSITITDAMPCSSITTIQINEPPTLGVSIAINNDEGSITATPSGGTPPYAYQWNDPDMQTTATATNLESGIYTLTVTDANGCAIVPINITLLVGIDTPEYLTNFDIFPNPSNGKFTIDLQFEVAQTATIQVLNALGQEIYQFTDTQNHFQQNIDISTVSAGIYFVVIATESGRVVRRMVLI